MIGKLSIIGAVGAILLMPTLCWIADRTIMRKPSSLISWIQRGRTAGDQRVREGRARQTQTEAWPDIFQGTGGIVKPRAR